MNIQCELCPMKVEIEPIHKKLGFVNHMYLPDVKHPDDFYKLNCSDCNKPLLKNDMMDFGDGGNEDNLVMVTCWECKAINVIGVYHITPLKEDITK